MKEDGYYENWQVNEQVMVEVVIFLVVTQAVRFSELDEVNESTCGREIEDLENSVVH